MSFDDQAPVTRSPVMSAAFRARNVAGVATIRSRWTSWNTSFGQRDGGQVLCWGENSPNESSAR